MWPAYTSASSWMIPEVADPCACLPQTKQSLSDRVAPRTRRSELYRAYREVLLADPRSPRCRSSAGSDLGDIDTGLLLGFDLDVRRHGSGIVP